MNEIVKTRERERVVMKQSTCIEMYVHNLCIGEHESKRTDGELKTGKENEDEKRNPAKRNLKVLWS